MAKKETPPFQIVPRSEIEGELSDGAFRTLLVIRTFCISSDNCWPSLKVLAEKRSTSTRTIRRNLDELEKKGYITIKRLNGTISIYTPKDLHRTVDKNSTGSKNEGQTADNSVNDRGHICHRPRTNMSSYNRGRNKKEEIRKKSPPAHAREEAPDETANRIFKLFEQVIGTPPLRGSAVDEYEAIEYHLNVLIDKHGFEAVFQKSNEVLTRGGTKIRDTRYLMTADGKSGALANVEWPTVEGASLVSDASWEFYEQIQESRKREKGRVK